MKSKILCLLLLIPIFLVIITFATSNNLVLPFVPDVENLILEHESKEAVELNKPYKLYGYVTPSIVKEEIVWWTSDDKIAYVEDGYLHSVSEGSVEVYASLKNGTFVRHFTAYVCGESDTPKYLIVNNKLDTKNGISQDYYFGEYDFEDGVKVNSKLKLDVTVLPLNVNQEVICNVKTNNATFDGEYLTFTGIGKVDIEIASKENPSIKDSYTFNVVEDGVNIYSYEDLLNATNRSDDGEIVVMQTNLESIANAYSFGDALKPNTKLFGLGNKKNLKFEYVEFDSTYDVEFLKHSDLPTSLKIGIEFKKDVYGNGFTINMHEMAYPSEIENKTERPILGERDIFKGPLAFVNIIGFLISGQDNIGFAVTNDNVKINNINLRNCNVVKDLTHLDYVGTVLEVMGDNVVIKDSVISNGRTVVRSFSSENLVIDNCLLQYAREFILKLGSNTFVKPEPGQVFPTTPKDQYNFLSPVPKDENGNILSDSSCKVVDTHFNNSGFFAIGIDTHFAGEILYDGTFGGFDLTSTGVYDLAGTSYATHLTLEGDVKIYNWRKLSELDASSLIQVTLPDLDFTKYFDVASMIKNKVQGTPLMIEEDGEYIVHGGIALFGGGRNVSTVTLSDSNLSNLLSGNGNEPRIAVKLDDPAFNSGLLTYAAGFGEFKFYLYNKDIENNLYKETASIDNLKR